MLTFGSCITFVLPVDVSSLAKISADAVARWVTLAAVEKVGMVPCHTFQDCCKNVIMQTSSSSVWDDERNDLWFFYTLLGFRSLQKVVGMTDGGSNPSGARDSLHHSHSCWPWGPSGLLYIEHLVSFLGINWLCVV